MPEPEAIISETPKNSEPQKVCFVIMPFTDPDEYEKGHFQKIYDQIFVPAIKLAKYRPYRVDESGSSCSIQIKLLKQLLDAPLVLCDLSSRNPNVLYELGLRQAFDKPVVLVQEIGTPRIFDINDITATNYRPKRLFDEVLEDRENIKKAILDTAADQSKTNSVMNLLKMTSAKVDEKEVPAEQKISFYLEKIMDRLSTLENSCNDKISLEIEAVQLKELRKEIQGLYNKVTNNSAYTYEDIDKYSSELSKCRLNLDRFQGSISEMDYNRLTHLLDKVEDIIESRSMLQLKFPNDSDCK